MVEIRYIEDEEIMNDALQSNHALIFKNSTQCGVSRFAMNEFKKYAEESSVIMEYYIVNVIENRQLSQKISEITGITHQSPQVIYIKDGHPVWNVSHMRITKREITSLMEHLEE